MYVESTFRAILLVVLLSSIVISGHYRKRARRSGDVVPRLAEGPIALLLRMAMALLLAASFLANVFAPKWLAWSAWGLPEWLRWAAAVAAIGCLPAIRWVLVSIGDNISETILTKSTHQLVTHGPYHWVRHPLYAIALLELLSLAVMASNWFLILFPVVASVFFRLLVIPREEANLIKIFGKEYEEYRDRTGALVPRVWP
jgi:protein-S-isoprenylcysteine O-methyltransferase Ste14